MFFTNFEFREDDDENLQDLAEKIVENRETPKRSSKSEFFLLA